MEIQSNRKRSYSHRAWRQSPLFFINLSPGDKIITQNNLYGGTRSDEFYFARFGIVAVMTGFKDLDKIESILKSDSK